MPGGNGSSGRDLLLALADDVRTLQRQQQAMLERQQAMLEQQQAMVRAQHEMAKTIGKVLVTIEQLVDSMGHIEARLEDHENRLAALERRK